MAPDISDNRYLFVTKSNRLKARLAMDAIVHLLQRHFAFQLWCIFGGTPLPEIRWTKKGGALPQGRTTYDNYGKTLVIKHVDYEDEGDYTCEASNGVGIAKSYSISLAVHASPYFTKVRPSNIFKGATTACPALQQR